MPRQKKSQEPEDSGSQTDSGAFETPDDGVDYLPRAGTPPSRDGTFVEVRRVVSGLREACGACGYRRICAFAPVKLQIEHRQKPGTRHRHVAVLRKGLRKLAAIDGDWEKALVGMLASQEKNALLAGCLLAQAWRKKPDAVTRLIAYTARRCDVDELKAELAEVDSEAAVGLEPGQGIDPDRLQARMFRGQVLRTVAFFRDKNLLGEVMDLLVLDADEEGRLVQQEAVAVLGLLIGRKMSADKWIRSLEKDAAGPFRATFATRAPGNGGLDAFFPYRRGKRRSYLYLRRDGSGKERLSSIDKIRIDSLLHRMFLVFQGDPMKTHRIFKELCRHINVRAGSYNVDHVLSGFERLDRDDLLLLGIYAPALARAVGHYLGIESYHLLVKFLYQLRSESGRRGEPKVAAHEQVVQHRDAWDELVDELGPELIKDVFSVLFRLNASYKKRTYTTPTYLKIGEVAYLLTAMSGWNPKGLEIELKQARKPLAFVAYGLQPPSKWSRKRVQRLRRAYEKLLDTGKDELERAVEQGMRYLALFHGYDSFDALEADATMEDWVPTEHVPAQLPAHIDASAEDFSEFEDSRESGIQDLEEAEDLIVVVEDSETDEAGRLITRRLKKQAELAEDDEYY